MQISLAVSSQPDEQTEIDDEISDQLKERCGQQAWHRNHATNPFRLGQNRGILVFAEDRRAVYVISVL
jgi:hypothetical protein